jgi:type I restriction enzyme, S subunit
MSAKASESVDKLPRKWKRYTRYKHSGIEWLGEVPDGWMILQLGWISDLIVPMRDKPPEFNGDIPWIRIEDFNGKYISDSKSDQRVSQEIVNQMNLKVFPVGTVLCSCSCSMGSTAIVAKPLISNQTFIGIVPKEELDSIFVYYLMGASGPWLQSIGSGAIQQYLSRDEFCHLKLALPPLSEQKVIATFLDRETARIDALIEKKERQIELLKEKRAALISHAVTKGLDPSVKMKDSGIEWLGQIPENWEIIKLKNYFKFVSGGTPSTGLSEYWDGDIPWVSSKDMKQLNLSDTEDHITKKGLDDSSTVLVPANSVLIGIRSGILKHTLPVAVNLKDMAINQDIKGLIPKKNLIISEFFVLFIYGHQKQLLSEWKKQGATVESLEFETIQNSLFPLPPLDIQNEIIACLKKEIAHLDSICKKISVSIEKLHEYRSALISAAVTGKIDVRQEAKA